MDSKTKEILDITQEECAEVVVAISKISRFGLDNYKPNKPKTNRAHLEEEIGDLMCMIDLLVENKIINIENIEISRKAKREKLVQWSSIFNQTL